MIIPKPELPAKIRDVDVHESTFLPWQPTWQTSRRLRLLRDLNMRAWTPPWRGCYWGTDQKELESSSNSIDAILWRVHTDHAKWMWHRARELLFHLSMRRCTVSVQDGVLWVGPKESLTEADCNEIRELRAWLVAVLDLRGRIPAT